MGRGEEESNVTKGLLYMIDDKVVGLWFSGKCRGEWIRSNTFLPHLPSGIAVLGIDGFVKRLL
jgi:hypothetical protein